jgi:uncharacterized BrkB/YihY/UPF0761 family membrane protein
MEWTHVTLASVIAAVITWLARLYFGSYVSNSSRSPLVWN